MKNVFRFLGVAFVACTMLVACGDLTVTATANDDSMGTVTGAGMFEEGETCTLTATPNAGYIFVKWSDGNTENPRTFTVTEDVTLVAEFAVKEGAAVGFKAQTWEAAIANSYIWPADGEVGTHAAATNNSSYPQADAFFKASSTGTLTDAINETSVEYAGVVDYVEYYESSYIDGGTYTYGDWWAKSATINVKGFDATALDLYFTVDATMFHATEALDADQHMTGIATASTANMTMVSNGKMTVQSSAKGDGPVINKKWGK